MHDQKARVYDTVEKKMFHVDRINWFLGMIRSLEIRGADIAETRHISYDPERLKLMWWTGVYDKNGKEIWDGDIFRDDPDPITVIEFDAGAWYAGDIELYDCYEDGAVLGNKWQNPELLPSHQEGG